jgi:hypothetical protein
MKSLFSTFFVTTVITSDVFCTLYQAFVLEVKLSLKMSRNEMENLVTVMTVMTKVKMTGPNNNTNNNK